MRKWLIVVVILGAVGTGVIVWVLRRNAAAAAAEEPRVVTVERGMIRLPVPSSARVVSNLDVIIMSKASGQVIELPYDVSDHVEKGALLVGIDPVDEQRNVRQAEVQLASSKARVAKAAEDLKKAEADLAIREQQVKVSIQSAEVALKDAKAKSDRMRELRALNRVSQEESETAQTAADLADIRLKTARIDLEQVQAEKQALETKRQDLALAKADEVTNQIKLDVANQRLSETKVYAPISGVVSKREVEIGQIVVSPTNNVSGGTDLLTLSDLSRLFVLASVDESDIGKVAVGQDVEISADAYPEESFSGKVVRIATQGESESNVVTFEVKIEVTSANKSKLKPEMTTDVNIIAAQNDNALILPAEAVRRQGEQRYVLLTADSPSAKNAQTEATTESALRQRVPGGGGAREGAAPGGPPRGERRPGDQRFGDRRLAEGRSGSRGAGSDGRGPEDGRREPGRGGFPGRFPQPGPNGLTSGAATLSAAELAGVPRVVAVGIDDGVSAEIVSGLIEGDMVLVPAGGPPSRWSQSEQTARDRMRMRMGGPMGMMGGGRPR